MKNPVRSFGPGAALLFLLTVAAYFPALRCGFIWDDEAYVTENEALRSLAGLEMMWTEPAVGRQQYYPLTFTGFWIQYHLWGLHPFGYHLVNILFHAANAVLLWYVLQQLDVPGSWWAAAVFALHPVQVESVAWVTEFKNLLSGLLSLLSLAVFLRYRPLSTSERTRTSDGRFYVPALLLFVGALLSKTAVCCLPIVIAILMWWKRGRLGKPEVRALVPWFAASLVLGLITVRMEARSPDAVATGFGLSVVRGVLLGSRAVWFYVGKLGWPANLSFVYPHWNLQPHSIATWLPVAGWLLVAGILGCFHRTKEGRAVMAGFGCYIVTLLPVLGFFEIYFFRFSFVADHFQYLASAGLVALGVGAAAAVVQRAGRRIRNLAVPAAVVVLLVLGARTWGRAHVFRNSEMVWRDALFRNPDAWLAHNNLGVILAEAGRSEEAIEHYQQALRINPGYAEAQYNLGVALFRLGRVREAISHWEEALRIDPRYAKAHNYLGNVAVQAGKLEEAMRHYEQALLIKPDYAEAYYNLGVVLLRLGREPEATLCWEQAVRIKPDYAEALNDLGAALAHAGRLGDAISQYEKALRIEPDFANAHNNLGNTLMQLGRLDDAIAHYEQALRIRPDFAEAHFNMAVALEQSGRLDSAIAHYKQALRIKPGFTRAQQQLSRLQARP